MIFLFETCFWQIILSTLYIKVISLKPPTKYIVLGDKKSRSHFKILKSPIKYIVLI